MPSADEIRDGQRTTWAGLSAGWEKWDSVIMDQLGPVGAAYRDLPVAGASAAAPPVVLSGRGSVRPYDHDGAAGVFGKVLTDRPEEQTSEAPSAPRSDDDHVRSLVKVEEP